MSEAEKYQRAKEWFETLGVKGFLDKGRAALKMECFRGDGVAMNKPNKAKSKVFTALDKRIGNEQGSGYVRNKPFNPNKGLIVCADYTSRLAGLGRAKRGEVSEEDMVDVGAGEGLAWHSVCLNLIQDIVGQFVKTAPSLFMICVDRNGPIAVKGETRTSRQDSKSLPPWDPECKVTEIICDLNEVASEFDQIFQSGRGRAMMARELFAMVTSQEMLSEWGDLTALHTAPWAVVFDIPKGDDSMLTMIYSMQVHDVQVMTIPISGESFNALEGEQRAHLFARKRESILKMFNIEPFMDEYDLEVRSIDTDILPISLLQSYRKSCPSHSAMFYKNPTLHVQPRTLCKYLTQKHPNIKYGGMALAIAVIGSGNDFVDKMYQMSPHALVDAFFNHAHLLPPVVRETSGSPDSWKDAREMYFSINPEFILALLLYAHLDKNSLPVPNVFNPREWIQYSKYIYDMKAKTCKASIQHRVLPDPLNALEFVKRVMYTTCMCMFANTPHMNLNPLRCGYTIGDTPIGFGMALEVWEAEGNHIQERCRFTRYWRNGVPPSTVDCNNE